MLHKLRRTVVPIALSGLLLMGFTPATADQTVPEPTSSDPASPSSPATPDPIPSDDPSSSIVPSDDPTPPSESPTPAPSDATEEPAPQMLSLRNSGNPARPNAVVVDHVLTVGDSGAEVQFLQQQLSRVFPAYKNRITADGNYTQSFQRVIWDIQEKNGISPDGQVGLITSNLLRKKGVDFWVLQPVSSSRALSLGQWSSNIGYTQAWLSYTYPKDCQFSSTDSSFGNQTASCVKRVQKRLGLAPTGVIDDVFANSVQNHGAKITIAQAPAYGSMIAPRVQWYGDRGNYLYQLQTFLVYMYPQFGVYKPDGILGSRTTASLKAFQKLHGLTPDGGYGRGTTRVLRSFGLDAWIVAAVKTDWPIGPGQTGSHVFDAQTWLVREFPSMCAFEPDGGFGALTKACVQKVQNHYGLTQTGMIDADLSAKLRADKVDITVNPSPAPSRQMFTSFLQKGSQNNAVRSLQVGLNKYFPQYAGFEPDGIFGGYTEKAVKQFQRSQGIYPDGMIGLTTAKALRKNNIPLWYIPSTRMNSILKQGSKGNAVHTLELALSYLYPKSCAFEADTVFTSETTACVKAAQKALGINPDGMVGATTTRKLQKKGIPLYFQGYFAPAGYLQPTDSITPLGWNTNTLTYGMNGVKVRIAQRKLGIWGTMTLASVDGRMQNAVRNFQRRAGISADGVVGATTWNKLGTGYSWYVDQYQASPIGIEATRSERIEAMINYAMAQRGSSYTWGGAGYYSLGFDCSGLALQSLYAAGLDPQPINVIKHAWPKYRSSQELYKHPKLKHYPLSQRQRGDLIFYKSGGTVIHVAIYLGNNQVVHTDYMGRPARVQHFLLNFGWGGTAGDVVRPFP